MENDTSPLTFENIPGATVWFRVHSAPNAHIGVVATAAGELTITASTPRGLLWDGAENFTDLAAALTNVGKLARGMRIVLPAQVAENDTDAPYDEPSPDILTRDDVKAIAREEAMALLESVMLGRPLKGHDSDHFKTQVLDITRDEIKKESRRAATAFGRALGAIPSLEDRGLSSEELPTTAKLISDLRAAGAAITADEVRTEGGRDVPPAGPATAPPADEPK